MEFIFEIGPISRPELAAQLAQGLDLRTELKSREKLPGLWKKTDALNAAVSDDAVRRRQKKNKVFGVIFLILGIFLIVPGLSAQNGLNGPLVGGAIALFMGISYLSSKTKAPPRKCQTMAQQLLSMRNSAPPARVLFAEDGITVNNSGVIPYAKIEGVLEAEDLYLLIINNSAMFLLKEEITEGNCAAFTAFLEGQPDLRYLPIRK